MDVAKITSAPIMGKVQSFKGLGGGYRIGKAAESAVDELYSKNIKRLVHLGKNTNEALNIIVTGIGTAFVAPFFIAFNPMSKEDKDTKIYSAMRQPISAVIATAAQLGIVNQFNKYVDKLASTGQLNSANLLSKPRASYLEKYYKLKYPEISKKELAEKIYDKQNLSFYKAFNDLRQDVGNTPVDTERLITSDFYNNAKKGLMKDKEWFKTLSGTKAEKNKAINNEVIKRASANIDKIMEEEAGLEWELIQTKNKLKTNSFDDILADLNTRLKSLPEGSDKKLLNNVVSRIEGAKIGKEDLDTILSLGEDFDEVLKNVRIKRLLATNISKAEDSLSVFKKYGGIALGLATLPITCGILNWVYPRLMEKIMPDVAKSKKSKGGK